jgi:hypothetical protein
LACGGGATKNSAIIGGRGSQQCIGYKEKEEEDTAAYHSWNTANPHVQSVIYYTAKNNSNETDTAPVTVAYRTCLINVANDTIAAMLFHF